jgi:hypothetical protein
MSANSPLPSGFDRWKTRFNNPNGTLEDYQLFLLQNRKNINVVSRVSVVPLPNGSFVPAANLSYAEISLINQEHVQQSFGQQ